MSILTDDLAERVKALERQMEATIMLLDRLSAIVERLTRCE